MRPALVAALAAVLALAPRPAAAQPALALNLTPAFETFSGTAARPDDSTVAGAFDFEHHLGATRLWYSFDGASYADEGSWASWRHGLGATWRLGGEEARTRAWAGASASLRRNGSSWSYANYTGLGAFANVETRPVTGLVLRAGYRFDARQLDDLPSLDQRQHDGFASLRANLPTRTTLIGELHLGLKDYDGDPTALVLADTPAATPLQVQQGQSGAGRGQGGAGQGQMTEQQMLVRPPVVAPAASGSGPARADLVSWMLRAAQSLADRTGLSLQYYQRVTSGDVPPALVSTPALFFDDGVYDDPFASDALAFRGSLKQAFGNGAWVEASGGWTRRDYRGQPALGLDGQPLPGGATRADRVSQASLVASIPVLTARTGSWSLALQPGWRYTDSSSNDAYYDYASHALELGLSLSY